MGETTARATRSVPEYGRVFSGAAGPFAYLDAPVTAFLPGGEGGLRILDVGCGNGHWAGRLLADGHGVVGVDASGARIEQARQDFPEARFELLEISEHLLEDLREEPFDVVVSTEVVEHLFLPRVWAHACFGALRPGGRFICSTPYHGYWKNLMISLSDGWDRHHHPLKDVGHIKFWSDPTLRKLLEQAGFENLRFRGAGRIPWLWKSMVMAGDRPAR